MGQNGYFLLQIALLLLGAHVGGIISKKLHQPAVLGQIIVGVLLGMGILTKTSLIQQLSEIGVIFLMFLAGLETDIEELRSSGMVSSIVAILGVVVPMCSVTLVAFMISKEWVSSILLGLISSATSVSISVQTLKEIHQLRSKQGITILGAAILDDIIGIILLTVIISMVRPKSGVGIGMVLIKIALFFIMVMIVGYIVLKNIARMNHRFNLRKKIVPFAMILCLMLAFFAEQLEVAAVTGAYCAGVIFAMTPFKNKITHDVSILADSFFTPIFFVSIGLGVQMDAIKDGLGISLILLVFAILGKIIGCGIGAISSGLKYKEAVQIGIGMVPRAEVCIIIANLGLKMGLIAHKEFAFSILLVLVTTLLTPSFLKMSFKETKRIDLS